MPTTSATRRTGILLLALSLAACLGSSPGPTTGTATTPGDATTTSTTGAAGETTIPVPAENDPCVTGERPFTQDGPMEAVGETQTDSDLVAEVSWTVFPSCEQVSISFVTAERAPAVDPPEVEPVFLRSGGVVRLIASEAVSGSALADQVIGTALVERVFVARNREGRVLVDVHLAGPAFVRVAPRSRQSQIVIDLIPGGPDYPSPSTSGDTTVVAAVTSPAMRYPLTVSGYVMGDGDRVEATLSGPDGSTTTVDTPVDAPEPLWRTFDVVFPSGPTGAVTIEVGDAPGLVVTIP
jgi:hypothetical protein